MRHNYKQSVKMDDDEAKPTSQHSKRKQKTHFIGWIGGVRGAQDAPELDNATRHTTTAVGLGTVVDASIHVVERGVGDASHCFGFHVLVAPLDTRAPL
jgi:hypothetical protein